MTKKEKGLVVDGKVSRKDVKIKLEQEASEIFGGSTDSKLLALHDSLQKSKQFREYMDFQKRAKDQDSKFRELVLEEMVKYDISSVSGDWGSISLVKPEKYTIKDINEVPDQYKEEVTEIKVDIDSIKEDYLITKQVPDGIEITVKPHIRVNMKKGK